MESSARIEFVPGSPPVIRRRWHRWGLAGAVCMGFAWLFWLGIRVTVESKDFERIGDIPDLANCRAMENVGPVRTRTYRHPHGHRSMWVTGNWPDEEFQKFAAVNDLFTEDGGDWGNRWAKDLPVEFTGRLDFTPQDTTVGGVIRGCEIGVKGARSKQTGKFLFMFSLKR